MSEPVTLESGEARAVIAARGAEPVAWSAGGRDLLWTADPAVWARTSPILFPIVGRARGGTVRVDGRSFAMPIHGFAADREFAITHRARDRVTLALTDDATTRAHFPFGFRLDVTYTLSPSALLAEFRVENTGERAMPYALGFHPGFRWPLADGTRDNHAITFAAAEDPAVPVITQDGLFADSRRPIPLHNSVLALTDALVSQEALCFLNANSRSLRYADDDSGAAITIELEEFPHIALWSLPPARFLCIEGWTGHGDPAQFTGDLFDKPSMRRLAPGASARHAFRMTFTPPP